MKDLRGTNFKCKNKSDQKITTCINWEGCRISWDWYRASRREDKVGEKEYFYFFKKRKSIYKWCWCYIIL